MLSNKKLFKREAHIIFNELSDEIYSQLYYLQIHCVEFLFHNLNDNPVHTKELIKTLQLFVEVGLELFKDNEIYNIYVFQCCGRVLRMLGDVENLKGKKNISRVIITGLLALRLLSYLPQDTSIITDLLSSVASVGLGNPKINFTDLYEAFIQEPYTVNALINIVNPTIQTRQFFSSCLIRTLEIFHGDQQSCWKLIQIVGQCSSVSDLPINSMKSLLSFTEGRKCLRKHVIMELGLRQSSEQHCQLSLTIRDHIITDIIRLRDGDIPPQITDLYEQLTYCLFVKGWPSWSDEQDDCYQIGWLILTTGSRSIVGLLMNIVRVLIESRSHDHLASLLRSPHMTEFNQLLLINLWHPNLADGITMQTLLDLCYSNKQSDVPTNYIEQLCLKIKTRWDTLKRFNERLSSIRKEPDTPTQLILDLTTMGNTSHLELVTGLLDPTGDDSKVVFDLLDRTGAMANNSLIESAQNNTQLETEAIEENCDKNIFYCSVSIRKLWECLVLFSPIETRERLFKCLHQQNIMTEINAIPSELSFYVLFQSALLNNDVKLCQELYQQSIVTRLSYLTTHISKINPLSLRLELLENLHSMLFVTEYDLFGTMLMINYRSPSYRHIWHLPETISVPHSNSQDKEDDVSTTFDKTRYVCSLFLLMDVVGIIDSSLRTMKIIVEEMSANSCIDRQEMSDSKMARTINYPLFHEIELRITSLANTVSELKWRIGLVTINTSDASFDSIGLLDLPLCIFFDFGSDNLTDICRVKPNKKNRSKTSQSTRRVQKRSSKERLSSFGEEKENSYPEISVKMKQLGIIESAGSLTHNISNNATKERFILFQSPSVTDIREPLMEPLFYVDDADQSSSNICDTYSRLSRMSKGNCNFLMNCLSQLMEPIDQMTVTILHCAHKNKADDIYKKYEHLKPNELFFDQLLAEIKYRKYFENLTVQLSEISSCVKTTTEVAESVTEEPRPFGQFNWSKISALKDKLSANKDADVQEIFNQLLSLNNRSRPVLKFEQSSEKISKDLMIVEMNHFNCGLFFDIAVTGSSTKSQLSLCMSVIESNYVSQDQSSSPSHLLQSDVTNKTMMDLSKYHRTQNLVTVVKQLLKTVTTEFRQDLNSYVDLEMNGCVEVNYGLLMDKWLDELHGSLELLVSEDESMSNDSGKSRWSCLNDVMTLIKSSYFGVCKNDIPFRHLDRPMSLYLDSLYSHLKVFVNFLDKYKNVPDKTKTLNMSSIVQLQHEFSVIRRSPLNALGELIFLKSEDPYSAEMLQISDDLGLNISAVVLENCIPAIDSCGCTLSHENEQSFTFNQSQRYNAPSEPCTQDGLFNLDPLEIVCSCLNKIRKIFLKNCHSSTDDDFIVEYDDQYHLGANVPLSSNVVTSAFSISSQASTDNSSSGSSNVARDNVPKQTLSPKLTPVTSNVMLSSGSRVFMGLCQDEDWQELLVTDIVDLENVDLDSLKKNHDKVAFFINLYNLMMIHMAVVAVENGKTSLKFRSLESKLMRSSFFYKVGQLGLISIEQISQYYLNIPDVTFTDLDINSVDISSSPPTPIEQLYKSDCLTCQNMAIFGMMDATLSGQPLKVYTPDSVHKDLQTNLSYTIKYNTTYETDKRQIFLPQIFKWYSKLVCADNSEQRQRIGSDKSQTSTNIDEMLVSKILGKCNNKVARQFSVMFRLDTDTISHNIKEQTSNKILKIIWQTRSESIGCNFIEKRQNLFSNVPKLNDNHSTWTSPLNCQTSVISSSPSFPLPNYQPTMAAINHLRDRSPLLACLAYLIIGDDFVSLSAIFSDNGAASSPNVTRPRSMSSVPLEEQLSEIRTYKYSRLAKEYPAIGNWIVTFWSEWLISRKSDPTLSFSVTPSADMLVLYCCSSIPIEIRWATFAHPLTKTLDQIIIEYSLNVMSRDPNGYLRIGAALRMLQSQTIANSYNLRRLLDIILEKSARYWANGLIIHTNNRKHLPPDHNPIDDDAFKLQENRLLDCIYAIKDDELRLSESLRYLDLLHIDNALRLMEFNYNVRSNNADHRSVVSTDDLKRQLIVMRIFMRIHDLVIACQNKYEIWWKVHIPTEFLDWRRLHTLSEADPDLVLKFLIKQRQFDLAKCWSKFYMPENGEQKIEAEYLVSLVTDGNDRDKVVELVSHISRLYREEKIDKFMGIIDHVIGHSEAPLAIILICAYAIKNNVFDEFESANGVSMCDWRDRVHRSWVGASMLRSISNEVIRDQYSQLVEYPHLIMEQLIMNAEIDVFRKMMDLYKEQKKAYIAIKRSQVGNKFYRMTSSETGNYEGFITELEPERINVLLTEYICKALELSAVREDEESDLDDVSISSRTMFTLRSNSISASVRPDLTSSSESGGTVVNNDTKMSDTVSLIDTFSLPILPPPPDKWYKDSETSKCMCCQKEKFSMFNRRHHCRRCGRVVCAGCSGHRMLIDGVTVRICDDCNRSITCQRDSDIRARRGSVLLDNQRVGSVAELLYSRHHLPPRSESVASFPSVPTFDHPAMSPTAVLQLGVGALENGWRLSRDPAENATIRQMFYYDDAPSVTIAFSLADFHSNSNVCGNLLLDRVEYLADFLKPMKNHLPNPEVDYLLVLDMAKQITYKAKLKFSRLNNDMDFDRAENYLSRLDLLSVLVKSNFGNYLPSLKEGSKFIERIQSLRDKLIREERLELARIVSSKAGLSSDPVFVAMGLHALEDVHYDEARKMFASCAKLGRYGSKPTNTLPYPVNEIMKILDGNKLPMVSIKEMVESSMDSEELIKSPDLKFREDREISPEQIKETIYYLDIYNAHLHCLQFLCRQQMWSKAIDYVFRKNVPHDVFIDGLILPAVNRGNFASVKSELLMKEGGVSGWKHYYDPLCKFLDKKSLYHDLLDFQERMGDHMKAARTLINYFYLRGCQSYLMLRDKIAYLENAQRHLEMYINKNEHNPNFDLQKLMKQLNLVKQQIAATLFLTDLITINYHQSNLGYIVQSPNPPSLFGNSEAITALCLMILFCRPNLGDGLQMLCPLMAQCHIYAEKILPQAAVWLLQHPQSVQSASSVVTDPEIAGVTAVYDLCVNICSCYRLDTRKNDEVLIAILPVIPQSWLNKANMVNRFIALFNSETKKVDAFIIVKEFKKAFINAVRYGYANEVQRIKELAEAAKDLSGVIDLCVQWLAQNRQ